MTTRGGRTGDGLPGAGIAVLCGRDGVVQRTLRDDLRIAERIVPGTRFVDLVDPGSAGKAAAFLDAVRASAAALDWDLNVPVDGWPTSLHFAGGLIQDQMLVVGLPSRSEMANVFEEMMRINNDQATALRAALKEGSHRQQARNAADDRDYQEISRVNNELAALHRELAKKNLELERLIEQQNQFLGMAAHDLRSPLTVILALSQFLELAAGPRLDDEQREFVAMIRTSSNFMLHLINDLLDISKIESGQLELQRVPLDLGVLVRKNALRHRLVAATKKVGVVFADAAEPVVADVDPQRIEQVLDNLVSNAVKFSHPGSEVKVALAREDAMAVILVRDQGVGMTPEQIERLFTPFQKGGTRGTGGEASTGLGLAIVKRIVTTHGGRIDIESAAGQGTAVRVLLPLVKPLSAHGQG